MYPDFSTFLFPTQNNSTDTSNPWIQSLNMMNQIWMGQTPPSPSNKTTGKSPEDLNTWIHQLKAVETWLKLNLSMVSSTIQGLEVQRATMDNLSQFMEMMNPEAFNTSSNTKNATDNEAPQTSSPPPEASHWFEMLKNQFDQMAQAADEPKVTKDVTPVTKPLKETPSKPNPSPRMTAGSRSKTATDTTSHADDASNARPTPRTRKKPPPKSEA